MAALLLKYYTLSMLLFAAQYALQLGWCEFLTPPLRLWLYGHRLAFDAVVSSVIFWPLGLFVCFDRIRDECCHGCSLHQLLIFRDPGQLVRNIEELRHMRNDSSVTPSFGGTALGHSTARTTLLGLTPRDSR